MKLRYKLLVLFLAFMIISAGCQRRLTPSPSPNNNVTTPSQISATKQRADYYNSVVTSDVNALVGMDGSTPTTYTIANGSNIRIVGKYDGYYVAILPNNQIGLVPTNSTKPSSPPQTMQTPAVQSPSTGQTSGTAGNLSSEASAMINLVNQARAQAGLSPLSANSNLSNIASLKAADIVNKNYFSHNSPTYGSPFDMMKTYGISYLYAGENLAINQNVQSAEQALMNSPDHKANIMNPNFTDIGVGVAQKSDGSKVYVQEFIGK